MKTRILYTKIWKDPYFYSLDDKEQLAFIFLLTNEDINLNGVYELNDIELTTWLKTTKERVEQIKAKFQTDKKFFFTKNWVIVTNYQKYNNFTGEKNIIAREKELALLPLEVKDLLTKLSEYPIDTVSIQYPYPMDTTSNQYINHKSVISNKKSVLEFEESVLEELKSQFPNKDVLVELASARDWIASTGKTYKDYLAFFRNWLRRSTNEVQVKTIKDERPYRVLPSGKRIYD